jgi:hypothetical protein
MKAIVIQFRHKNSDRWADAFFIEPFAVEDKKHAEELAEILTGTDWEYRAIEKEIANESK